LYVFNSEPNKGLRLTTPLASRPRGTDIYCRGGVGVDRVERVDGIFNHGSHGSTRMVVVGFFSYCVGGGWRGKVPRQEVKLDRKKNENEGLGASSVWRAKITRVKPYKSHV
jgi:hypothetical protein